MAGNAGDLSKIRAQIGAALDRFVDRQRAALAELSPDLAPCADAIAELLTGGKRLRAAFCYWGWRACGGTDDPAIFTAAAALELLHASALVHDDVMDASDTRRGKPAVHRRFATSHELANWRGDADRFGAGAAILIGDLLLAWTDELLRISGLAADSVWRGLSVLDTMRTEVLAGQFLDLAAQASANTSVANALSVVTNKSAKYTVERPLQLGVALHGGQAGADREAISAAFSGYGLPLGIAFQLRDDILGVFGDPATTGKPVNDDLREGKRTVMLAIAAERATPNQRQLLDHCLGDPSLSAAAAQQVREIIVSTGALAESELMIAANVKAALTALDGAEITGESKVALADLAIAATVRAD
jgi:geranylgeranyl diphosphate synthase, type I